MATTLQDLRDVFYSILRETSNSSAYPLTFVDLLLNAAQQRICLGNVMNPLSWVQLKKWQLPFLLTDKFYTSIQTVYLSAAATVWGTTLTLTTTNLASSWVLYIDGNIITYTAKTATQVTGCTNILYAHPSGSEVSTVYAVPADYGSIVNVVRNGSVKLQSKLYDDIFEDLNSKKHPVYPNTQYNNFNNYNKPFYTIKDRSYIILFDLNEWDKSIRLRYEKLPTTMSAGSDNATIDNDVFAKTTIPYIAVWEMLYNRWEEARAAEILNFWLWQVKEMYTYYNQASSESQSWTQYKMAKWALNV